MRRISGITLCAIAALLACSAGPAAALQRRAPVGTVSGGNALLPDGFYITPTLAPGAIFQRLGTGWDVNPAHGRRNVAAGTHPIPDSIEIIAQVSLEILDGLPVNSCHPSVRLHLLTRFPHLAFRNTERPWLYSCASSPFGLPTG
jgi:hypothetical protein